MDVRKLLIVGVVTLVACDVAPPAEARARLEAVEAEGQALTHAADDLEARLLAGRSALAHWEEMARRHREVSALACRVTEGHVLEMGRNRAPRAQTSRPVRVRVVARAPEASTEASTVSIQ